MHLTKKVIHGLEVEMKKTLEKNQNELEQHLKADMMEVSILKGEISMISYEADDFAPMKDRVTKMS